MTREEIMSMVPGRELDALVAEKVFGLQVHWEQDDTTDPYPVDEREVIVDFFSTDILAAWDVLEKFNSYQISKMPIGEHKGEVRVFINTNVNWAYAESATEAICKAALIAVMEG